jgi:hypothetical protein
VDPSLAEQTVQFADGVADVPGEGVGLLEVPGCPLVAGVGVGLGERRSALCQVQPAEAVQGVHLSAAVRDPAADLERPADVLDGGLVAALHAHEEAEAEQRVHLGPAVADGACERHRGVVAVGGQRGPALPAVDVAQAGEHVRLPCRVAVAAGDGQGLLVQHLGLGVAVPRAQVPVQGGRQVHGVGAWAEQGGVAGRGEQVG